MNFDSIINSHPTERDAIKRLKQLLERHVGTRTEFDLNRLCDLVRPKSREELSIALGELARQGQIRQILRVMSPKVHGGIGDFESLAEIPRFMLDSRSDLQFEVTPDDLQVVYVLPGNK
jgi:hypothetical protein